MNGWIGVDLDGTLAKYDGWVSEDYIGEPIPKMVEIVKQHLEDGVQVKIFTARVYDDPDGRKAERIKMWCLEYIGHELEVTNQKDFGMITLYDDRCVQIMPNTGETAIKYNLQLVLDAIKNGVEL